MPYEHRHPVPPVRVTVELDPKLWWKLAGVAQRRNLTVDALLAEYAAAVLEDPRPLDQSFPTRVVQSATPRTRGTAKGASRPTYNQDELRARIRMLHRKGKSDAEMSRLIGCSAQTVTNYRRQLGLPRWERSVQQVESA